MNAVHSEKAPKAIGPYSQAIATQNLVFVSGQLGINPATGEFAGADIKAQTTQAMENIKAILHAAGLGMESIAKTTILLKSLDDFAVVNEIYGSYFKEPYPARATFQVAKLPKDGLVEIEAIAQKK
ncbi:RidA family protein [Helicobacter ailurogastricus]|uniref:Bona fide RidA/YjgF/TdcF/RutC subgroup n=1 Tax=Helicobacter ailurogastricus TaxID=1578720 RepID=A0A0K2Y1A8_9HELI|nr:RidA family protein [Helicobacter ailurogastricus]CRF41644.1 Bona fide RidA/YjgF/TdcF/RutC subgroup [Helicobacter ailurogastricus]CRF42636.1 Bona fide RidA/YjgF/TdcF/RutC subgroup [Helicobacter ailurogastricus]CRF44878.1 Bona fide RidA/YjgF/TdcF/RutC subgroup [Helicobacter ailurogastricus]CRF52713.1 Endoribonuclease L-PSP [Helicobacter ailurogastricus]BDQ28173.1 RutC family protein [Helicobacter ailurogastricus]